MASSAQVKSAQQRERFVELLVQRSTNEYKQLFKRAASGSAKRAKNWIQIVDELHALPGARYDVENWRRVNIVFNASTSISTSICPICLVFALCEDLIERKHGLNIFL